MYIFTYIYIYIFNIYYNLVVSVHSPEARRKISNKPHLTKCDGHRAKAVASPQVHVLKINIHVSDI